MNSPRPSMLRAWVGALALLALVSPEARSQSISWFSEPKSAAQLTTDLTSLYRALDATGQLPTQKYVDREGLAVEKILYQERQFFGYGFPKEIEGIMCKHNRRVCRVSRDPSGQNVYTWTNGAGDELVIPRLEFTAYTAPQLYQKKRSESLASIVVHRAKGCLELSDECQRRIRNLNRLKEDVLDPRYEGPIVVPALALRLTLPEPSPPQPLPRPTPSPDPSGSPSGTTKLPNSWGGIERNVVLPPREQKLQSEHGHTRFTLSHERIYKRIGVPLTPVNSAARTLAVFDAPVDATHCYLANARIKIVGLRQTPDEVQCGGEDVQPLESAHGTHMVGLMVAQRDGTNFGINPRTMIVAYPVRTGDPRFLENLADALKDAVETENVDLGNLSLSVIPQSSGNPAFNRLQVPGEQLWVVAAGNAGEESARHGCQGFPACAGKDLPNVLSVVAINLDEPPALWPGSNSGDDYDLAAPGEAVVSTTPGGRLGAMSGTSQATAIVSASASMLLGRHRKIEPWDLRARLMYTTDLYSTLENKARAGRLNLGRALTLEHDIVVLKNDRALLGILRRSGTKVRFTKRPGGAGDDVDMVQLKRIVADDKGRRFIFRDARTRGVTRLERVPVATINAPTHWMMDKVDGGEERIEVAQIRDFTACHLISVPGKLPECWKR